MSNPIPDTRECVSHHLGAYCLDPRRFPTLVSAVVSGHVPVCSAEELDERRNRPAEYCITGGVAIIELQGVMQRSESKFDGVCSTVRVRRQMRQAADDPAVRGVAFAINSPGGNVAGQTELVDDLDRLCKKKPTCSIVMDQCCSAAYWFAARTGKIYASRLADIGSIGCYCVLLDVTGKLERDGLRPVVISSGANKGLGADGSVPDELAADVQMFVNRVSAEFSDSVSAGRNFDAAPLATGKTWIASDALNCKLIDAIANFDDALADFSQTIQDKELDMAEQDSNNLEGFQALADRDGYEFAKAHYGKPEHEINLARKEAVIAKLQADLTAATGRADDLAKKLADVESELAVCREQMSKSKVVVAPGENPAASNPRPDAATIKHKTYNPNR